MVDVQEQFVECKLRNTERNPEAVYKNLSLIKLGYHNDILTRTENLFSFILKTVRS